MRLKPADALNKVSFYGADLVKYEQGIAKEFIGWI